MGRCPYLSALNRTILPEGRTDLSGRGTAKTYADRVFQSCPIRRLSMHGGRGRGAHVVYVAGKLKQRVEQHLVRRDSSVTTGASAVCLNPDLVTEVTILPGSSLFSLSRMPLDRIAALERRLSEIEE